jgi:hypothetical protein
MPIKRIESYKRLFHLANSTFLTIFSFKMKTYLDINAKK